MNCPIILFPAYGRNYMSAQDAVDDYLAGEDFKLLLCGGQYCSCRDFKGQEVSLFIGGGLYKEVTA